MKTNCGGNNLMKNETRRLQRKYKMLLLDCGLLLHLGCNFSFFGSIKDVASEDLDAGSFSVQGFSARLIKMHRMFVARDYRKDTEKDCITTM
jgi:hypothetical protein